MNVLWLPHAPWHVPQRARFFAEALAERHQVWVTDWDGEFRSVRDLLTRRYLFNAVPRAWRENGVAVQHVPRVSPALYVRALRRLNDAIYLRYVRRLVDRHGIDVIVGCFAAPVPAGVTTVADVFDDNVGLWQEGGVMPRFADEIRAREAAWIDRSRATVAVSSVLADRLRAAHPRAQIHHVSNGVDTARYRPARAEARRALGLDPNATYVGNVGRLTNRREAERLLAVATALAGRRGVEMVVVGDGAAMRLFERGVAERGLTGVRSVGFAGGDRLLRWMQALDVGLCPYDRTPANDARVPMRLLHYSAVGATVVCPRLVEVERMRFANVVFAEAEPDAFAAGVVRALDQGGARPDRIEDYDIRRLATRYEAILRRAQGA